MRSGGAIIRVERDAHYQQSAKLPDASMVCLDYLIFEVRMLHNEDLSLLIGDIYDAALQPDAWPQVLAKTAKFVGGFSAALFSKDATRKTGDVYYHDGGITAHFRQIYFETYIKLDPATTGHYFAEIESPVSTCDFLPYDEFIETRFYKEWAQPQRIVDFVSATLEKSATSAAMFGVFRKDHDGIVDEDVRCRMRLVVPHIRRAVLIDRVLEQNNAELASFADTLDGLSAGMFLVDKSARIVHANANGHAMLTAGTTLRAVSGRLTANGSESRQALCEIFMAASEGDIPLGSKGVSVPLRSRDGERYVAHVLPLTGGIRRQAGKSYAAAAAVFVRKAALETSAPPEIIAKLYKLTPSELRVLLAVVQVGGVSETAEALGIGEATVKTHLHRLFGKTGTSRQAELVKLVASYANPLVH